MPSRDPFILLSFVNTRLRGGYGELCAAPGVDESALRRTQSSVDYRHGPGQNRFI